MSVAGYLSKGNGQLRMPDETVDSVGTEYDGGVLSGRISVEQGRAADAVARLDCLLESLGLRPGARVLEQDCSSVDDYDPVLRWHCRL